MESHQLFHGRIEDVHFPALLLEISQRKESGVLHISHHKIEKDIFFHDGHIVFAKSNDPDERLGELLLRRGKITCRQLEDAARKIVPGMRLGTILVQEGHIKPNDLYHGVIDQVEEILYSLFEWTEGEYKFSPGEPSEEVITLGISTPDIVRTGIGRIWRWSWIREGTISIDAVLVRREMRADTKKMMITPGMESLLELLKEPLTLRELLNRSEGNNFETCKMVWSLLTIGILEHISETPKIPAAGSELETPMPDVTSDVFPEVAAESPAATVLIKAPGLPVDPLDRIEIQVESKPSPAPAPSVAPTAILDPSQLHIPGVSLSPVEVGVELSFSDFADLTDAAQTAAPKDSADAQAPAWEKSVAKDVENFNEKHRYLFEMLRIEMGAGVTNFLVKVLKKVAMRHPLVFEGAQMNEFGDLIAANLVANIESNNVEGYHAALESLFREEHTSIQVFLDKKRLELIEAGLARIEESQKNRK